MADSQEFRANRAISTAGVGTFFDVEFSVSGVLSLGISPGIRCRTTFFDHLSGVRTFRVTLSPAAGTFLDRFSRSADAGARQSLFACFRYPRWWLTESQHGRVEVERQRKEGSCQKSGIWSV